MYKRGVAISFWLLGFAVSFGQTQVDSEIISTPNSLQFFVLGDWGRKGDSSDGNIHVKNQEALAFTMDRVGMVIKPDFLISTGDNFYPAGVSSTSDPRWKITYENVYTGTNLQNRWYVVLGNHDHGGNIRGEIDYDRANENRRWYLPSRYYSEVMTIPGGAKVKFIFIDTTPLIRMGDEPQLNWLAHELSDTSCQWKWVVGHHPLYSGNHRTAEQRKLQKSIETLLVKSNVDVYLCGHDHNLQYLKKGKINYFISGAGSEIYRSRELEGLTQFIYCKEGVACTSAFMVFSLASSSMTVQMIDAKGRLHYKNVIQK